MLTGPKELAADAMNHHCSFYLHGLVTRELQHIRLATCYPIRRRAQPQRYNGPERLNRPGVNCRTSCIEAFSRAADANVDRWNIRV
ncbi:hypothetical protein PTI98_013576 [Pleurotus ostreatus]|nr:hypothetical protein PTI98_013576 [Pleurotus ostreatus]